MKIRFLAFLFVFYGAVVSASDIQINAAQTCNESVGNQYQWGDKIGLCFTFNYSSSFEYEWYLSKDKVIDAGDLKIHSETMTGGSGGGSVVRTYDIPCDGGGLSGQYYLIFIADPNNKIFESDENNNIFPNTIVTINPESTCTQNTNFTITYLNQYDVQNNWSFINGTYTYISNDPDPVTYLDMYYYLSTDPYFDHGTDLMIYQGYKYVNPPLNMGIPRDFYIDPFSPFTQPTNGNYYFIIAFYGQMGWEYGVSNQTISVGMPTSTNSPANKSKVSTSQNPSKNGSFIFESVETITKIEVIDETGRVVDTVEGFAISGLSSGVYFARVNLSDGSTETLKLLVN